MPDFYCTKKHIFPKNIFVGKSKYSGRTNRKKWLLQRKTAMKEAFRPTLWQDIVMEDVEIENYLKKQETDNIPTFDYESRYIKEHVYPTLIPAFKKMCAITMQYCAHCRPVTFFNFLDYLAEILWNTNKMHNERRGVWLSIYRVNEHKPFYKSRPFYPYHLFLTRDEAATIIQKMVRGSQTRLRYNLVLMKDERDKIKEAMEKRLKCYEEHKEVIENIRDCLNERDNTKKKKVVDP